MNVDLFDEYEFVSQIGYVAEPLMEMYMYNINYSFAYLMILIDMTCHLMAESGGCLGFISMSEWYRPVFGVTLYDLPEKARVKMLDAIDRCTKRTHGCGINGIHRWAENLDESIGVAILAEWNRL